MNLRIPGPTPCPPEVLEATARQMIDHRSKAFSELLLRLTSRLKEFFQTKEDVFLLTGSGTGGMEAAIVNTLSPGDRVLAPSNGYFGDRFAGIAAKYGAEVKKLDFPQGTPIDPGEVRKALAADPAIKAVLVVHNETSAGVTNDLKAIAQIAKSFDKLLLVDAISSLGAIPLESDAWGCDVVVTASQKAWMAPPGLAMVSFNSRAWEAHQKATMPRYYFDFTQAKKFLERGQTPWTPALPAFYGLDQSLEMMAREGREQVFARHKRVGDFTRKGVKSLGLSLLPQEKYASNTVTAVKLPEGVEGRKLLSTLRDEFSVSLAGGQGQLEGKIFRIGHMGYVSEEDIAGVLKALEKALPKVGLPTGVARAK